MLRRLLEGIDSSLPGQCAVCHAWPARTVCEACVDRFAQPRARCARCALPVAPGISECGRCLREPPPLHACHAAVTYDYPWSALIAQYKFHGQAGWARVFATLMRSAPWVEPAVDAAAIVVPMPLAPERLAERGFNQSLLLARELAPAKARADLLLRVRHTPAQSALDLKARHANVKGAFALDPMRAHEVEGKAILLVDDVMTSGASLHAAALVLRAAGASQVSAVVLARTDEPA